MTINATTSPTTAGTNGPTLILGKSLFLTVEAKLWEDGEKNANKVGGHLATISNANENQFLTDYAVKNGAGFWLGYTNKLKEGEWRWTVSENSNYTNWSPGNPDNSSGLEHYAVLQRDGSWNDFGNYYWNFGAGEEGIIKGIAEIPFIRRGDSAYVIVEGPTWEEAEANAIALGGHLATINDAEEDEFLTSKLGLGFFFGLTDKEREGLFSWVSGEPVEYTNWYLDYQPDNDKGNQDYGAYHPSFEGGWDDVDNGQVGVNRGIAEIQLPPNNTPTGNLTLSGELKAGETISIDASAIHDADNRDYWTPSYEYTWEFSQDSGTTWTTLTSADATDGDNLFTLTSEEVGKQLRGVVRYLDGYGTNEAVESDGSLVASGQINNENPVVSGPVNLGVMPEDGVFQITSEQLLANATDPDGDELSVVELKLAAGQGSITDNSDSSWTFSPDANWNGEVSFSFGISNGKDTIEALLPNAITRKDSVYVVVDGPTWEEAEANAQRLGGHLITINDQEEWNWFKNEFTAEKYGYKKAFGEQPNGWNYPNGEVQLWVGLNDKDQEGSLAWTSGEQSSLTLADLNFSQGWEYDQEKNDYGVWQWENQRITNYDDRYEQWIKDGWTWWQRDIRGLAEIKLDDIGIIEATANLNVIPVNDSPALNGTPVSLSNGTEDVSYTLEDSDLLEGYSDVDGDPLSINNVNTASANGSITNNGDGTWTYTPSENFSGEVTINYTVSDGTASIDATTSLSIESVNDGEANFIIKGKPKTGKKLKVEQEVIDPDGDGNFTHEWQASEDGDSWTGISKGERLKIDDELQGKQVRVLTSYTDGQGFKESVVSDSVEVSSNDQGDASFAIVGKVKVGKKLKIEQVASDPNGDGNFLHTWQASNDGESWREVDTGNRLKIDELLEGHEIRLRTSYTDGAGFSESVVSESVSIPFFDNGDAVFSIVGEAKIGQTLNIQEDVVDPDGNGRFLHTWQVSADGNSWSDLNTGDQWTVETSVEGKQIRVLTSYTDGQDFAESVVSDSVEVSSDDQGDASFAIVGKAKIGKTLKIKQKASDPDGDGDFLHTWQASNDGESWRDVGTDGQLLVNEELEGHQIRVQTSYVDGQGISESIVSDAVVVNANDDGDAAFSIIGKAKLGKKLSIQQDAVDPDGDGVFLHTWQASTQGSSWVDIDTGARLKVEAGLEGKKIRVRTSYTDAQGFAESVLSESVSIAMPKPTGGSGSGGAPSGGPSATTPIAPKPDESTVIKPEGPKTEPEPDSIDSVPATSQESDVDPSDQAVFDEQTELDPAVLAKLSPQKVADLAPEVIQKLGSEQIERLPKRSFKALDVDQLSRLSKDAVTGMTTRQLKTLSENELAAFNPGKIRAIDSDAITGLKPAALDALGKRQIKAFTDEQLAALNKRQIRKADEFIDGLSDRQRGLLSYTPGESSRINQQNKLIDDLDLTAASEPLA